MTRELTGHHITEADKAIIVTAEDAPENHKYRLITTHSRRVEGVVRLLPDGVVCNNLFFQKGPVSEGVNGITDEALLEVLIDRFTSFQLGPSPCRENELALYALREARVRMNDRTRSREARGVEGTDTP